MNRKNIFVKCLFALSLPLVMVACSGDDDNAAGPASVDFASIASTANEEGGTITIPLRGSSNGVSVAFGGSATEGEDFELVGVSDEGVEISIIDDGEFEDTEKVIVRLVSSSANLNGNSEHTVSIVSQCTDLEKFAESDWFVEEFDAIEDYGDGAPYGPYHMEFERDETDPNKYWTDNFWDSGLPAYIVYDPATNKVSFPTQTPLANFPTRIITSTPATVDQCNGGFTITTNYRGNTWQYIFTLPL